MNDHTVYDLTILTCKPGSESIIRKGNWRRIATWSCLADQDDVSRAEGMVGEPPGAHGGPKANDAVLEQLPIWHCCQAKQGKAFLLSMHISVDVQCAYYNGIIIMCSIKCKSQMLCIVLLTGLLPNVCGNSGAHKETQVKSSIADI